MKAIANRQYTEAFRQCAVKQVIEGGRGIRQVARSLEMSDKTLANWVRRARRGERLIKSETAKPVDEMQAELSRLRSENARLKMEKEILKKRRRTLPRNRCEVRLDARPSRGLPRANDVRATEGVAQWFIRRAAAPVLGARTSYAQLRAQMQVVQPHHRGRYGRRRMHRELVDMNAHPIVARNPSKGSSIDELHEAAAGLAARRRLASGYRRGEQSFDAQCRRPVTPDPGRAIEE